MDTRQRNSGTAPVSLFFFFSISFLYSNCLFIHLFKETETWNVWTTWTSSPQIVVVRERAAESASRINKKEKKKKDIPSERSGLTDNF